MDSSVFLAFNESTNTLKTAKLDASRGGFPEAELGAECHWRILWIPWEPQLTG